MLLVLRNAYRNTKKQKPFKWKDVYPFPDKAVEQKRWDIKDVMAFFPFAKQGGARKVKKTNGSRSD